jgi:hypothetical protein
MWLSAGRSVRSSGRGCTEGGAAVPNAIAAAGVIPRTSRRLRTIASTPGQVASDCSLDGPFSALRGKGSYRISGTARKLVGNYAPTIKPPRRAQQSPVLAHKARRRFPCRAGADRRAGVWQCRAAGRAGRAGSPTPGSGRRRWAILLRRGAMMQAPTARSDPQSCDGLRFRTLLNRRIAEKSPASPQ